MWYGVRLFCFSLDFKISFSEWLLSFLRIIIYEMNWNYFLSSFVFFLLLTTFCCLRFIKWRCDGNVVASWRLSHYVDYITGLYWKSYYVVDWCWSTSIDVSLDFIVVDNAIINHLWLCGFSQLQLPFLFRSFWLDLKIWLLRWRVKATWKRVWRRRKDDAHMTFFYPKKNKRNRGRKMRILGQKPTSSGSPCILNYAWQFSKSETPQ